MPTFSDQQIIRMGGRGIAPSALTPNQRKLAYYVQRHPGATLAEAREGAGITKPRYTKKQLEHMAAEVPWEDLTPAQKKLMKGIPDEHVTPAMIAYYTGIPEREIMKNINMTRWNGIDPGSLVYKSSRGFFGKTNATGKVVVLYGQGSGGDEFITFNFPKEIERTIRLKMPCSDPPCPEGEVVRTWIPLKNGAERSNITDAEGIAA